MLTGIYMASGQSKRMGDLNKLLLPYNGSPLFTHSLNSVSKSKIDELIVITCHTEIISFCKCNKIKCVLNDDSSAGQSSSINLGVTNSSPESDYMFFVADQPLIKTDTINKIIDFYYENKGNIIVPKYKNSPANPKIFPNKLRGLLLGIDGEVRGRCIIEKNKHLVAEIAIQDGHSFFDIDTPSDYEALINNTIKL